MIIADTPHIFMPEWPRIQTSSPRGRCGSEASEQSHADKSMNGSLHQVFPFRFGYSDAERVFASEEDGFPLGTVEQAYFSLNRLSTPLRAPMRSSGGR
jgi:hypothetical protein